MEITTRNAKFLSHSDDYGDIYMIECPECHQEVKCSHFCDEYPKCKCGYGWSIDIVAVGYRWESE